MDLVPGAETVHQREAWQDPRFPVFGPLDDPSNNDLMVIHYTADDDLIDGDPGESADDLPAYLRAIQYDYVTKRGYSIGYLFAVDWLGGIWQLRGWEYQSAANKGHNDHTFPVLVLVDGSDPATPEAVESIRLIRKEAERRAGRAQKVVGHQDIGATACPGYGLQAQVDAGVFYDPPAPPPPIEEDDMTYLFKLPNGDYGLRGSTGSRRVSAEEFGETVPPRTEARNVVAGSNEEYWITQELKAYDRSLGV